MADARQLRLAAVREGLPKHPVDALLVSGLSNIRYLSGFSGSNSLLLVSMTDALLLTDFRYTTQGAEEAGDVCRIRIEQNDLWAGLWDELKQSAMPLRAIAFESSHLSHRDFARLQSKGDRWTWLPVDDAVESLRERKDSAEVDAIATAGRMATRALGRTLEQVYAGMSERQIAGVLERNLREEGSDGFPFPTLVASGARTALPHARPGRRAIAPGDLLLLDFGAVADGYCADVTRTVVIGRASERQREVHAAVEEANGAARKRVSAGMLGKEADAIAREVLSVRGFGESFGHGLGHGLGLDVHEAPRLSRQSEKVLPQGAVVTIEPGVYLPGWGGVRIEDDVHLGPAGCELLTDFPRSLIELG